MKPSIVICMAAVFIVAYCRHLYGSYGVSKFGDAVTHAFLAAFSFGVALLLILVLSKSLGLL